MSPSKINLTRGSVLVFEGLDKAGKSTQLELLRARVATGTTLFTHLPSGITDFSRELYSLLEANPPESGLARQLTHLASHSENIVKIINAAGAGSLVLDRWWWSTLAYGWYGGDVPRTGLSESAFRELIDCIWAPVTASTVFLFLTPVRKTRTTSTASPTATAPWPRAIPAPSHTCRCSARMTHSNSSSRHCARPTWPRSSADSDSPMTPPESGRLHRLPGVRRWRAAEPSRLGTHALCRDPTWAGRTEQKGPPRRRTAA